MSKKAKSPGFYTPMDIAPGEIMSNDNVQPSDNLQETNVARILQESGVYPYPQFVKPLVAYIAAETIKARVDENRTYWWHQQKMATAEGVSKHALDRIAELKKETENT